ncbi:hypothetical protein [Deefgea salmonis]|uniref:Uncharacterized protein n=1 Tax=Deefgea salmonis TaxID=2875502 RepID=A0ABS8BLP4_9NEIS|nr:hypothetical protein [Deefgea salmonis]MCB5196633.1 hypothetical protein [Deefgea salmonis]
MSTAEIVLYGMGAACSISFCQMLLARQDRIELIFMATCSGLLLVGGVAV